MLGGRIPGLKRELRRQAEQGILSFEQVDRGACNGCGVCSDSCPMDLITLDTGVSDEGEYPPCSIACPAGVDTRRYVYLLRLGRTDEAYALLREALPLPAVTGRVCPHPCETECARREVDDAVNINSLERFIADQWHKEKARPTARVHEERIAIVGSGPAGLSCAYFLALAGYPVTVFEAQIFLGGMLRAGIPEYRLPKHVLDGQIDYIRDMGVEFRTGVTVGRDKSLDQLRKDYRALFFATGNQLSRAIDVEGAGHKDVVRGLDFLRRVNLKGKAGVKERVVVVGGGNVAVDVALSARRMGAKEVRVVCSRRGMGCPLSRRG